MRYLFGPHIYRRRGKEGYFHTEWDKKLLIRNIEKYLPPVNGIEDYILESVGQIENQAGREFE